MSKYIKLQDIVFKIKDIVLIQANKDLNNIAIYTTNYIININYKDSDITKDMQMIHDTVKYYFLTTITGDFLNLVYVSFAKLYESEDNLYLKYNFNERVQIQYPNIIYLDKSSNVNEELREQILLSIGESDYESFISLY